ncbi:hypothetical protein [Tateyamaria sp.]
MNPSTDLCNKALWNVPAEVIVGNTLSWDIREVWYTPAHHLGLWKHRLRR